MTFPSVSIQMITFPLIAWQLANNKKYVTPKILGFGLAN